MNNGNKLKTVKNNLNNIKKDGIDYTRLDIAIAKANDIYFLCNHFVNAYFLYCLEKQLPFPNFNVDFFSVAFKAISKKSRGPKCKGENEIMLETLQTFFKDEFIKVLYGSEKIINIEDLKFDATNLSYITGFFAEQMEVMFRNNIIINFFKYVHQYVNSFFISCEVPKMSRKDFKKLSNKEKQEYLNRKHEETIKNKAIRTEIMEVKNDLCENRSVYKSDKKYHNWINENKSIIFPKLEKEGLLYEDDIKISHTKYLKHMMLMNIVLENSKKKMFSALPLRTELYDKYVTLNTFAIRDIFNESGSELSNKQIWEKYFNINYKSNRKISLDKNGKRICHPNWYFFNDEIRTDGLAVSISLIREDQIEIKTNKTTKKVAASKFNRQFTKNMGKEEKAKFKADKKEKQKLENIKNKEKERETKNKAKEEFKKLDKNEQAKIKKELKFKKTNIEYIEDAVNDEPTRLMLKDLLDQNLLAYADLGSKSVATIKGKGKQTKKGEGKKRGNKILFSYTSKRRLRETKRIKYMEKIDEKKKTTIIKNGEKGVTLKEKESELSKYNSKTMDYKQFLEFTKIKIGLRKICSLYEKVKREKELKEIMEKLNQKTLQLAAEVKNAKLRKEKLNEIKMDKEKEDKLNEEKNNSEKNMEVNCLVKKLKWYGYINKQRHQDNLLNKLEEIYGKKMVFVVGDWNGKGKIKRIGMPNMGTRKLISKRFKTYLLNEHNTSALCWKTHKKGENIKAVAKDKDGNIKYTIKLHSVITFKMDKNNEGCINRDNNACNNFEEEVKELILTKTKPACFMQNLKQSPVKENKKGNKKENQKEEKGVKVAKKHLLRVNQKKVQESAN